MYLFASGSACRHLFACIQLRLCGSRRPYAARASRQGVLFLFTAQMVYVSVCVLRSECVSRMCAGTVEACVGLCMGARLLFVLPNGFGAKC